MTDPSTTHAPPEQRVCVYVPESAVDDVLGDLVHALGHQVSQATRDMFLQLREASRPLPQEVPHMPDIPQEPEQDVIFAPPQPVRPAPEALPCRGIIIRKVDVTGVSGTGQVGEVCVFSDGAAVYRWLGGGPQNQPKFEFYDNPGLAPFLQISGHNGNTEIIMIDDPMPHQQ